MFQSYVPIEFLHRALVAATWLDLLNFTLPPVHITIRERQLNETTSGDLRVLDLGCAVVVQIGIQAIGFGDNGFASRWSTGIRNLDCEGFVLADAAGGTFVDTSARLGDSSWQVLVPMIGKQVEFASTSDDSAGGEEEVSPDSCQTVVVHDNAVLRARPSEDSIGKVGTDRVCLLSQRGGKVPAVYHGVIDWNDPRNAHVPRLSLRLVHVQRGWVVADFNAWGEA
jgi:hypothetical protein